MGSQRQFLANFLSGKRKDSAKKAKMPAGKVIQGTVQGALNGAFNDAIQGAMQGAVHGGKGGPFWNRLPQLLNLFQYQMQAEQAGEKLEYEAIHLHVSPSEIHPILAALEARNRTLGAWQASAGATAPSGVPGDMSGLPIKGMSMENFKFLMDQAPAVRTVEFSGKTDPLRNAELFRMVDYAHRYNGAEVTVITDGFLLSMFVDEVLKSRLHTLAVRIHAHRPSDFAQLTGMELTRFVTIRDNVTKLVKRKRALSSSVEIELLMTVDLHNFRAIPDMIRFAEELGVDGIRLENYLSPEPGKASDRSLYAHQKPVTDYLRELRETVLPQTRLVVNLPGLLDDEDIAAGHRNCLDPYTTVSVDAEFNVSGCSRHLLFRGSLGKIWDENFWNNDMYLWLRQIHGAGEPGAARAEVPMACRTCPRNMPKHTP